MSQHYSDPKRESDPHALPDIEIFQWTAQESVAYDEDLIHEYMKREEFKLAAMNSSVREKMLDCIVSEKEIKGGFFWWSCSPGCIPDGPAMGPFESLELALADARALRANEQRRKHAFA